MNARAELAEILKDKGAQKQLALKVGCSQGHLSLYLSGERRLSVDLAKKISAEAGIPASRLLDLEETPEC